MVGRTANTWGRFDTKKPITVWTEVEVRRGVWSTSQKRTTTAGGNYVIPLTYGATTPGTKRWRVAGRYPDGRIVRTSPFSLKRLAKPVAYSAGAKPVGAGTSTWGRFDTNKAMTVWTEVQVRPGVWRTSQIRKTTAGGNFTIPLTYGASTAGTTYWRVAGRYPNGQVYRSNTFKMTRTQNRSQKAVAFAQSRLGDSYRYGGTGPSSWDCSGLTGGAWKSAGVKLPRTSQQQYAAGKKVSKSALKPGDLIFYYSGRSHVGIYVGDGKIIHASRPGKPVEKVSMHLMPYNGAVRPG
ncbi:C40 family peptidase [Enemella sp. A6]|uniref:C40 family peptidase n=1 Tax=Enemella sp. A6 TaxID=3440152 RepID=UPI003EBBEE7B